MGYDRGDSFPFDFGLNGISFGSENRKEATEPGLHCCYPRLYGLLNNLVEKKIK